MKKARSEREPTRLSVREMPEIDFSRFRIRKNRFAKRIAREGIEVLHEGPSARSLREMPELDLNRAKVRRNPYAHRIRAGGITLQVGRGRPTRDQEVGPTVTRSIRLPPRLWAQLEKRARAEGIAVHALLRRAIAKVLGQAA